MKIINIKSKLFWFIIFVVTLRVASTATANLSFFILAIYALYGRAQAIQALSLSAVLLAFNPEIAPEPTLAAVGRYAVLFAATYSVLSGRIANNKRLKSIIISTVGLTVFFVAHAAVFSLLPVLSVLKSISWGLATITLMVAWSGLNRLEQDREDNRLYLLLVAIAALSLLLAPLGIGYEVNKTGFQGILNHPQAFGLIMSFLAAWTAGRMLSVKNVEWPTIVVFLITLVLIFLSESRTAGFSLILGLVVSVTLTALNSRHPLTHSIPGLRSKKFQFLLVFFFAAFILSGAGLSGLFDEFVSKSGRAGTSSIAAAYTESRGGKIEEMWENIYQTPLQGIGFGIASDPLTMHIQRDPIFGIPLNAPVEKGVLPIAVLEELGVFGALIVASWIFMILKRCLKGGIAATAVFLTGLFLNMGEAILFSSGGIGLLLLSLIGWAYAKSSYRCVT